MLSCLENLLCQNVLKEINCFLIQVKQNVIVRSPWLTMLQDLKLFERFWQCVDPFCKRSILILDKCIQARESRAPAAYS
ncbi:hypothetical protein L596_022172 [Steinernema carpocapsae]|uniref:Uncharacterized protein n=1 Tax=Steinernema carpocapsae TaxID=34508 RepID=A0A4U5MKZ0_STECR|nr:hypothetical protein L596_022172 [Steinernema carpocapsae]